MTAVTSDTYDEKYLFRQCTTRAISITNLTKPQCLSAIAFDHNPALLNNVKNVDNGDVRTLTPRRTVSMTPMINYWSKIA